MNSNLIAVDIKLVYSRETPLDDELLGIEHWEVQVRRWAEDPDDEPSAVGYRIAHVLCADEWEPQAMDSINADAGDYLSYFFDAQSGELRDEIAERLEMPFGDVLILDRLVLKPEVRGHDFGVLIAAQMVHALGRGCAVVIRRAGPVDQHVAERDLPEEEKRARRARLAELWQRVGLTHLVDGYLLGDLTRAIFGEVRCELRRAHGLR